MRGFDRPLKPEWIKDCIDAVIVNEQISHFKEQMKIAIYGIDGEDGNRKIRTIISRYFLYNENSNSKNVFDSKTLQILKKNNLRHCIPLLFFTILCKEPLLQQYSKILMKLYSNTDRFNNKLLQENAVKMMGDRDISGRSLRNFINTMVSFKILKEEKKGEFIWNKKIKLTEEQTIDFLKIYSENYLRDKHINLYSFPEEFSIFYDFPDFLEIANKYNNILWKYTRRTNTAIIVLEN